MSKGLIIGQGVFMVAIAAVVVLQVRGQHAPAPAAHAAAGDAHEDKDDEKDEEKSEKGEKGEKGKEKAKGKGKSEKGEHAEGEHAEKSHGEKGHGEKGHGEKGDGKEEKSALGDDAKSVARELLAGNERFATGHRTELDLSAQREASAGGQHPSAMVLGCADSRVPPELVFDRGVGELFVVRSAGNIAEPVAVGSLEYAAEHLHPKVLVILGHDECGAVKAALSGDKMPTDNLKAVVNYIHPALRALKSWGEGPDLTRMGVEANVRRQSEELLRRSPILRKAVSSNELTILRAVYDIHSGRLRPL